MGEFKSGAQAWVAGQGLVFNNWIDAEGPNGRRNIIKGFKLCFVDSSIDVATAAIQGEDIARLFARILVEQVEGLPRVNNVRGDAMRQLSYHMNGAARFMEHGDVAIGCATDVDASLYVPMEKEFAYKEGMDFSMPAEVFKAITLTCPTQAELDLGISAVTINSGTYYIIALVEEEGPEYIKVYAEDQIREFTFSTAVQGTLPVGGLLAESTLYERGASGGVDVSSSLTGVLLDGIYKQSLRPNLDLAVIYGQRRLSSTSLGSTVGADVYTDPHTSLRGVPMYTPQAGAKMRNLPFVSGTLLCTLVNSGNAPTAVYRTIGRKTGAVLASVMQFYGFNATDFTIAGTKPGSPAADPENWGDLKAYMALQAPRSAMASRGR